MTLRALVWSAVSTKTQTHEEKDSLPQQRARAEALIQEHGWLLVEVLEVPGHSRDYIDFHEAKRDMEKAGILAFTKLEQHWVAKDFDVLIVRDGSRFARTQALHAYVTSRTIVEAGAQIYAFSTGWVTAQNYIGWTALDGYRVQSEMTELTRRRVEGINKLFQRGLPVTAVPHSHDFVRDRGGKVCDVIVRESRRAEFERLAELILTGTPYYHIETLMYERYGYGNELNEPYNMRYYYRLLTNPMFWGHLARGHADTERAVWTREPGHPLPEGVEIQYGIIPAVYDGELAERVSAEMSRRAETRGRNRPSQPTHGFVGMVMCGECGGSMSLDNSVQSTRVRQWLRCNVAYYTVRTGRSCSNRATTSFFRIYEFMDGALRELVLTRNISEFTGSGTVRDYTQDLATTEAQIDALSQQIRESIGLQTSAPPELQSDYAAALRSASQRREALRTLRDTLMIEASRHDTQIPSLALDAIAAQGVDAFWQLSPQAINSTLHQLMGNRRLVVLGNEIVGTADKRIPTPRRYNPR